MYWKQCILFIFIGEIVIVYFPTLIRESENGEVYIGNYRPTETVELEKTMKFH